MKFIKSLRLCEKFSLEYVRKTLLNLGLGTVRDHFVIFAFAFKRDAVFISGCG